MRTQLAIIEGRWWPKQNTSVRPFFDVLSDVNYENTHEFRYEMFHDADEFKKSVKKNSSLNGIRYLYVAAHGNEQVIRGIYGDVTLRQVANAFPKTGIDGVFFGSCEFGGLHAAAKLLLSKKTI